MTLPQLSQVDSAATKELAQEVDAVRQDSRIQKVVMDMEAKLF